MAIHIEGHDALTSALRAARENEHRWMEMSPESSADNERMEQWISIARLRRLEVKRIEALLAETIGSQACPRSEGIESALAGNKSLGTPPFDNSLS
jgi:hypothetical protein